MGQSATTLPCGGYMAKDAGTQTPLTPSQIETVRRTWKIIAENIGPNGLVIFRKFFEICPEMKYLFPRIVLINNDNKLVEEIDEKMLLRHALTVMEGLGAAVEGLDDIFVLDNVLVSLGQTHVRRHVSEGMLKKLWPALNHGLKICLGDGYNKEVCEAWKKMYQYICMRMKQGMKEAAT